MGESLRSLHRVRCPCIYFTRFLLCPLHRDTPVPPLARMRRMTRPVVLGCLLVVPFANPVVADPPGKEATIVVGVRRAMDAARQHLQANRPADAITVLEAELLNADGVPAFLDLLRGAYAARLRELEGRKADAVTLEAV